MPVFIGSDVTPGFLSFQTFSLETGAELLIKGALLDRFLACMKPASITLRPLRAGVFFEATLHPAKIQDPSLAQLSMARRLVDLIEFSTRW